jgi:hypothetical protein
MDRDQLTYYAELCGWALARGHARTGRATLISGYLGSSSEFDKAIAQFSVAYAEQNEKDYQALVDAVATGRIQAVMGLLTANPQPRLTGPLLPRARAPARAAVAPRPHALPLPDRVFHTYSTYARGTDSLGFISNFLGLTPLGREEPKGRSGGLATGARDTLRYHDQYDD